MTAEQDSGAFLDEDFVGGMTVGQRWHYVQAPGFLSDDGTVTILSSGISIAPPAHNPDSGQPMFIKEADGFAGHLKWMVVSGDTFSTVDGLVRSASAARRAALVCPVIPTDRQ